VNPTGWCTLHNDALMIRVVVHPGRSRRGFQRVEPRGLIVALHAPPTDGRANDELIELMARTLRLPPSSIALVRGQTSRQKTLRVATASPAAALASLQAIIPS
jgi:uncharacterized protein (TIGR00251 family)